MKQLCTLRGHKAAISSLAVLEHNSTVTVVSGDDDGWVVWWNLNALKPLGVWRAHEKTIVTIKQTGNRVMTQSRDASIKFWDLFGGTNALRTDFPVGEDDFPVPVHDTIPFNSLNFCNVDYMEGNLVTPALEDSNGFDMCRIELDPFDIHAQLTVNPGKLYTQTFGLPAKDFGIVMRLLFVDPLLVFAGFESGHVIGFKIDVNNVTIVYTNDTHKPSPILSMVYHNSKLFVGSARKKLTVHDVEKAILGKPDEQAENSDNAEPEIKPKDASKLSQMLTNNHQADNAQSTETSARSVDVLIDSDATEHNLKHSGVHLIASYEKLIIAGFWNGVLKGFDRNFRPVLKYESRLPRVSNLTSNNSSEKADIDFNVKLTEMISYEPRNSAVATSRSYKLRAMHRSLVTNKSLLLAGYGDGKILVFEVNQRQDSRPTPLIEGAS